MVALAARPRRSDGGGWSKMSDEPLAREREAREREPIERVRARLEALVMANAAPRCGARSTRTGKPCRAAAMPNGRCKLHGGKSTGPRTPEGLERSRRANWKHGYYSREAKAERSRVRAAILAVRYLRDSTGWKRPEVRSIFAFDAHKISRRRFRRSGSDFDRTGSGTKRDLCGRVGDAGRM